MNKEQNAALEAERVAAESWYEEYAAKGWSVSKIATTTAFKAGIEYARAQLAAPAGVADGWHVFVDYAKQLLNAEQARLSAEDYIMDSDDCIEVLQEAAAPSPAPACEECGKPEKCFDCAVAEVPVMTAPAVVQPAQVMGRVYDGKAELNSIGRALPDHSPLYAEPAPASDVVQVPRELLERIVKRGMRLPDETQHQHLEQLNALLNGGRV
jgi:hypothetical protein